MSTIHTWANGFGIWHVRVSRTAAGPLIAARRGLRDELLARENNVDHSVWMHPIRVPDLDDDATIVYRERSLYDDPDPGEEFSANDDGSPADQPWDDPKVREQVIAALRANAERDHFADYDGQIECAAYAPLTDRKFASGSPEERQLCDCGKVIARDALALVASDQNR